MPQEGTLLALSISSVESAYASESSAAWVNLQRSCPRTEGFYSIPARGGLHLLLPPLHFIAWVLLRLSAGYHLVQVSKRFGVALPRLHDGPVLRPKHST